MILRVSLEERGKESACYRGMSATHQTSDNQPIPDAPAFYKLSSGYFGAETTWDQAREFLFFTILGVITAWPIISMIVAASRMLRN